MEALAIHDDQIERYGGSQGVRDLRWLEARLFSPQTGYYADLSEEAAALRESRAQHHTCIDGNRRVAFAKTSALLMLNEGQITAEADETFAFTHSLYQ